MLLIVLSRFVSVLDIKACVAKDLDEYEINFNFYYFRNIS